jgi:hypothetical protein
MLSSYSDNRCKDSDSLQAGRSGVRISVRARFSGLIQPPVKWVMGLFPEGKADGAGRCPPISF